MSLAITRQISPSMDRCELTHLARQPIDLDLARAQHEAYEHCLRGLGCTIRRLPAAPEYPDSVFVEDCAIVLDELAIIARPGAESRRGETADVEAALAPLRPIARIGASVRPELVEGRAMDRPCFDRLGTNGPTLDGGDVLRVGRTLFVGVSTRTNTEAIEQLRRLARPFGYSVVPVEVRGCLHLKSAVTEVAPDLLVVNPEWIPAAALHGFDRIDIDPREPFAANALRIGRGVVYPTAFPRTRERLETRGITVHAVDLSELAKAEGAVTCCSLIVETDIE